MFSLLTLGRASFNFPILTEKERQLMKVVIGGRSSFKEAGFEVLRLL